MNDEMKKLQAFEKGELKRLREAFKLSQDELGFQADVHQARISRAERGYLELGHEETMRLRRVLAGMVDSQPKSEDQRRRNCLDGKHEPDEELENLPFTSGKVGAFFTMTNNKEPALRVRVRICKHCGCLYAEKS